MPNSDRQPKRFERLVRAFHPAVRAYPHRRCRPIPFTTSSQRRSWSLAADGAGSRGAAGLAAHGRPQHDRHRAFGARLGEPACGSRLSAGMSRATFRQSHATTTGAGVSSLFRASGLFSQVVVPAGTQNVRFSCAALRIGVSRWSGARGEPGVDRFQSRVPARARQPNLRCDHGLGGRLERQRGAIGRAGDRLDLAA